MFEGTDLNLAYSGSMYEMPDAGAEPSIPPASGNRPEMAVTNQKDRFRPVPPPEYETSPPPPSQKYAQRNPSTYAAEPPTYAYEEEAVPLPSAPVMAAAPGYSFWDKLAARKTEVYKLFAFSLVIVLAIAIHFVASHYVNQYIGQAFLSDLQEFLVRLGYPVLVILVIWVLKAL